jgi:hypothetical protein
LPEHAGPKDIEYTQKEVDDNAESTAKIGYPAERKSHQALKSVKQKYRGNERNEKKQAWAF